MEVALLRCAIFKSNAILASLVVLARVDHEDFFIDLVAFLQNDLFVVVEARLETLKQRNHESLVRSISPVVKVKFKGVFRVLIRLCELEMDREKLQEVLEEEIFVNVGLNVVG